MAMPTRLCCAVLTLLHRWAIGHEFKSATVRREAGVLGEGGEQSFLFCTVLHFADTMTQAGMKQEETTLQEGWTISWRTFVGAAGDLKVGDSFKCPHCSDKCDHILKHLLYEEEEVVVNQMNGLAVKDSAGYSDGSSASSGTYYSATEGGEED